MKNQASTFLLPTNPLASYLAHKDEFDAAVAKVLNGGWYILGEETKRRNRYIQKKRSAVSLK